MESFLQEKEWGVKQMLSFPVLCLFVDLIFINVFVLMVPLICSLFVA